MEFVINDNKKASEITNIFNNISNFSECINLVFTSEKMYVQELDKSRACLFEFVFINSWFDTYNFNSADKVVLGIHVNILYRIFNTKEESQTISINYVDNADILGLNFINGKPGEPNKYFEISLIDIPYSPLTIPENTQANAEFTISTVRFKTLIDQLMLFDEELKIICNSNKVLLEASGMEGKMKADLPHDDLIEYMIDEINDDDDGDKSVIDLVFSITYIKKMCLFYQLTEEVSFRFSDINPMELKYDFGNECYLRFFLAPQIRD